MLKRVRQCSPPAWNTAWKPATSVSKICSTSKPSRKESWRALPGTPAIPLCRSSSSNDRHQFKMAFEPFILRENHFAHSDSEHPRVSPDRNAKASARNIERALGGHQVVDEENAIG